PANLDSSGSMLARNSSQMESRCSPVCRSKAHVRSHLSTQTAFSQRSSPRLQPRTFRLRHRRLTGTVLAMYFHYSKRGRTPTMFFKDKLETRADYQQFGRHWARPIAAQLAREAVEHKHRPDGGEWTEDEFADFCGWRRNQFRQHFTDELTKGGAGAAEISV